QEIAEAEMLVHLSFRHFDIAIESGGSLPLKLRRVSRHACQWSEQNQEAKTTAHAVTNHAGTGAVSSFRPSVRKFNEVDAMADPAITRAIGRAGLSMNPRNVVMMAAIRN